MRSNDGKLRLIEFFLFDPESEFRDRIFIMLFGKLNEFSFEYLETFRNDLVRFISAFTGFLIFLALLVIDRGETGSFNEAWRCKIFPLCERCVRAVFSFFI